MMRCGSRLRTAALLCGSSGRSFSSASHLSSAAFLSCTSPASSSPGLLCCTRTLLFANNRREAGASLGGGYLRGSDDGGSGNSSSSAAVRRELKALMANPAASPVALLETEVRLAVTLARSRSLDDRVEALERGESLWEALDSPQAVVGPVSRTTMKVTLCGAMRRCALECRQRELSDRWTQRFAERARSLSPFDFDGRGSNPADAGSPQQRGSVRGRARPGTGITEEDLAMDAAEEERNNKNNNNEQQQQQQQQGSRKRPTTPMETLRQEMLVEHPQVQYAFRAKSGPGPRYTG